MWSEDDRFAAFFRKTFVVPQGAAVTRALMTVEADDDVAVWVNGVEVYLEPDFGVLEGNRIIRHTIDFTGRWSIASGRIYYAP